MDGLHSPPFCLPDKTDALQGKCLGGNSSMHFPGGKQQRNAKSLTRGTPIIPVAWKKRGKLPKMFMGSFELDWQTTRRWQPEHELSRTGLCSVLVVFPKWITSSQRRCQLVERQSMSVQSFPVESIPSFLDCYVLSILKNLTSRTDLSNKPYLVAGTCTFSCLKLLQSQE